MTTYAVSFLLWQQNHQGNPVLIEVIYPALSRCSLFLDMPGHAQSGRPPEFGYRPLRPTFSQFRLPKFCSISKCHSAPWGSWDVGLFLVCQDIPYMLQRFVFCLFWVSHSEGSHLYLWDCFCDPIFEIRAVQPTTKLVGLCFQNWQILKQEIS